jgi:hypothetical protein
MSVTMSMIICLLWLVFHPSNATNIVKQHVPDIVLRNIQTEPLEKFAKRYRNITTNDILKKELEIYMSK